MSWRTSTYSSGDGNCLEASWQTSSYTVNADCVEGKLDGTSVLVRDTKDRGGPRLEFSPRAWTNFVEKLKVSVERALL